MRRATVRATVEGEAVELRPYRVNYSEGYLVYGVGRSARGRLLGAVSASYGARQYSPVWDACDRQGNGLDSGRGQQVAMFPVGLDLPCVRRAERSPERIFRRAGRYWPTRKAAVAAVVRASQ
jgi:hypothetical protein